MLEVAKVPKLYQTFTNVVSDQALDRRGFLQTAARFLVSIPLLGFFGSSLLKLHPDLCQKASSPQTFSAGPITVYRMVPLPGLKYDKAETRHMANKIFPSIEAARARRPHRGFLYGLKAVSLPCSLINDTAQGTLFCNRKDFDQRVRTDRRHWQNLGVNVDAVFGIVGSA
jgi:hypothetical protein